MSPCGVASSKTRPVWSFFRSPRDSTNKKCVRSQRRPPKRRRRHGHSVTILRQPFSVSRGSPTLLANAVTPKESPARQSQPYYIFTIMAAQQLQAQKYEDSPTRRQSDVFAVTSALPRITCPPAGDVVIKEEKREHGHSLPLFADLIRASYLANAQSESPLPSLSKTSFGFLLDTARMQSAAIDSTVPQSLRSPCRTSHGCVN
jgi:hypothetical protein